MGIAKPLQGALAGLDVIRAHPASRSGDARRPFRHGLHIRRQRWPSSHWARQSMGADPPREHLTGQCLEMFLASRNPVKCGDLFNAAGIRTIGFTSLALSCDVRGAVLEAGIAPALSEMAPGGSA
jgi:hypothetical protein